MSRCRKCGDEPRAWEQLDDGLCPGCYFEHITEGER